MRAHHPRLDHIHGTAHRRRHEPSHETRRKMRRQVIPQRRLLQQYPLKCIVARQLTSRHEYSSHTIRAHPAKQRSPSFFLRHAYQSVYGVFVIPSFLRGEGSIMLHADVEHVGGVAGYAAEETAGGGHGDEGGKRGGGACGAEDLF